LIIVKIEPQNLVWMLISHMFVSLFWRNMVCFRNYVFGFIYFVLHQIQAKKMCLILKSLFFCFRTLFVGLNIWVTSFSIRKCLACLIFIKRKMQYFVLKICLPNTALKPFLSLWFLVKGVFCKYTLLFFNNIYFFIFLCFCQTNPQIILKKFWKEFRDYFKIIYESLMFFNHYI
jgi:hypothetical protein